MPPSLGLNRPTSELSCFLSSRLKHQQSAELVFLPTMGTSCARGLTQTNAARACIVYIVCTRTPYTREREHACFWLGHSSKRHDNNARIYRTRHAQTNARTGWAFRLPPNMACPAVCKEISACIPIREGVLMRQTTVLQRVGAAANRCVSRRISIPWRFGTPPWPQPATPPADSAFCPLPMP